MTYTEWTVGQVKRAHDEAYEAHIDYFTMQSHVSVDVHNHIIEVLGHEGFVRDRFDRMELHVHLEDACLDGRRGMPVLRIEYQHRDLMPEDIKYVVAELWPWDAIEVVDTSIRDMWWCSKHGWVDGVEGRPPQRCPECGQEMMAH